MPDALPVAAAAGRNTKPIRGVLEREMAAAQTVLEIGSGTGQHAVAMAAGLAHLVWQPTDLAERLAGIRAHIAASGLGNVAQPLFLDVHRAAPPGRFDAVFTANTLHIVNEDGVSALVALVGRSLDVCGRFCCYGPFRRQAAFSSASNEAFDASLRSQGTGMGIRDLEAIDDICVAHALERRRTYAMPSNNLLLVWEKIHR